MAKNRTAGRDTLDKTTETGKQWQNSHERTTGTGTGQLGQVPDRRDKLSCQGNLHCYPNPKFITPEMH
jgi:hypothetical protein